MDDGSLLKLLYMQLISKLGITPDLLSTRLEEHIRRTSDEPMTPSKINGKSSNVTHTLGKASITWKALLKVFRILRIESIDVRIRVKFRRRKPLDLELTDIALDIKEANDESNKK